MKHILFLLLLSIIALSCSTKESNMTSEENTTNSNNQGEGFPVSPYFISSFITDATEVIQESQRGYSNHAELNFNGEKKLLYDGHSLNHSFVKMLESIAPNPDNKRFGNDMLSDVLLYDTLLTIDATALEDYNDNYTQGENINDLLTIFTADNSPHIKSNYTQPSELWWKMFAATQDPKKPGLSVTDYNKAGGMALLSHSMQFWFHIQLSFNEPPREFDKSFDFKVTFTFKNGKTLSTVARVIHKPRPE